MPVIFANVAEEKRKRPRTIPIWDAKYKWWTQAVERELERRKWKRADLARELGVEGWDITRSVNRGGATVDLVTRIAEILGLPYPVFLPESEDEAKEMMERRTVAQRSAALQRREEDLQRRFLELDQRLSEQRPMPRRRRRAG